ncbi:unnamed protein product [Colletotrichum noveboracense]|uniref:Uncharacterized protein n=1 Tax=Colletotrichum noveboracense TaxID=2664923 RepID=A0A9W4RUN6_9PEZI|nr:unnamed protein product [Colletotrichum noveboracense]
MGQPGQFLVPNGQSQPTAANAAAPMAHHPAPCEYAAPQAQSTYDTGPGPSQPTAVYNVHHAPQHQQHPAQAPLQTLYQQPPAPAQYQQHPAPALMQAQYQQPPTQAQYQQPPAQVHYQQPPTQAPYQQGPAQTQYQQPPSQAPYQQPPALVYQQLPAALYQQPPAPQYQQHPAQTPYQQLPFQAQYQQAPLQAPVQPPVEAPLQPPYQQPVAQAQYQPLLHQPGLIPHSLDLKRLPPIRDPKAFQRRLRFSLLPSSLPLPSLGIKQPPRRQYPKEFQLTSAEDCLTDEAIAAMHAEARPINEEREIGPCAASKKHRQCKNKASASQNRRKKAVQRGIEEAWDDTDRVRRPTQTEAMKKTSCENLSLKVPVRHSRGGVYGEVNRDDSSLCGPCTVSQRFKEEPCDEHFGHDQRVGLQFQGLPSPVRQRFSRM